MWVKDFYLSGSNTRFYHSGIFGWEYRVEHIHSFLISLRYELFFSNTYTPLKVPHVHGQSTPSAKFKPIGEFRTFRTFEELEFLKWNDLDHGWIGWIILFRLYPYLEPIRGFLYLLQIDSSSTSSSNLNRLSQRVKYPWTSLTIYPILKLGKSPINILGSLVNTVLKTNRI